VVSTPVAPVRGWGTAATVGYWAAATPYGQTTTLVKICIIAPRGGAIYYWDATTAGVSTGGRAKYFGFRCTGPLVLPGT
jgi:hypothetical protein